jgi:hypothetical protein
MSFALSAVSIPENDGGENEKLFHDPAHTCSCVDAYLVSGCGHQRGKS